MTHETYMHRALAIARQALDNDEFPVGCIVVYEGEVIAQGERIHTRQPVPSELDHAEMIALRHLERCDDAMDRSRMTLYATLEPCLMCFSAIMLSRIGVLVYAYEDAMGGGTAVDRSGLPPLYRNNGMDIVPDVCRRDSLALFQEYFKRSHTDYWQNSLLARYTLKQPLE